MKLLMYSVFDSKAGHYGRPIFAVANGEAMRSFELECSNPDSMLHRFPGDFRLFRVGLFDQYSGTVKAEVPVEICCAQEFVRQDVSGRQLELIDRTDEAVS